MTANSTDVARPSAAEASDLSGKAPSQTTHSSLQERRHLIVLALMTVLLASIYPLQTKLPYKGSADLHAAIEMLGALFGLVTGFALIVRFYALGNRFYLFVGLAFFVNGAEDLVHGLLSSHHLQQWTGLPASSLGQFIPGTHVTGRLLMGVILLLAPFMTRRLGESLNPKRETKWASLIVLLITMAVTALAFRLPLPRFIYPDRPISRPVDFLSAIVLLVAMVVFLLEYHRGRDMLTWWILLSIAVNVVGQVMMSFSKSLYDPLFDIAHVYKVFGYMIPLLGFSLYQIAIITERKRAEEALQESEEKYRQLVENAREAIAMIDNDGRFLVMNNVAAQHLGGQPQDFIGRTLWDVFPREVADEKMASARGVIQSGQGHVIESCIPLQGGPRWFLASTQPVKDSAGKVISVLTLSTEITGRKRAEEALRVSEERFALAVQGSNDGIWDWDILSDSLYWSPRFKELLGYAVDELDAVFETFESHLHPDDTEPTFAAIEAHLKDRVPYDVEERLRTKSGQYRWFRARGQALWDEAGSPLRFAGSITDITERKRAEEQLQRYAAELEQSNEEVKRFAYIISHDLRAPLVNLKGFAAELRAALAVIGSEVITALPTLDEKQRQTVTMALEEDIPEGMDDFINAVLKLSRLGHRELELEPIDMNALVQATLQTLAHQIEERQVKVTVGPLSEVVADWTSMEQIMGNILTNAVKYLDPGRSGEIEITAECDHDVTTFHIRDNGRGIAEEDMDKVFAAFRRAGRQDVPGEGMGLAYVQALIRRHGGRIWCESEPGVGTTFTFTLSNHLEKGGDHV
jgi:PAS domain S-box-containing protein